MSSSLYAQLPQTAEMELAAKMADLQSEVVTTHTGAPWEDDNAVSSVSSVSPRSLLSRVNTRRTGSGVALRASTLSCRKLLRFSSPKPSRSCRARWEQQPRSFLLCFFVISNQITFHLCCPKSQFTHYLIGLWQTVQMWHSLPLDPWTRWGKS